MDTIFQPLFTFLSTLVATPSRAAASPVFWLDTVTVGLGGNGNLSLKADVDLVVGEPERLKLLQLGTEMMAEKVA